MIKQNLREGNYVQKDINIKKSAFHTAASLFILASLIFTFVFLMNVRGIIVSNPAVGAVKSFAEDVAEAASDVAASTGLGGMYRTVIQYMIYILMIAVNLFIYFFIQRLFLSFFCVKKFDNTKLMIMEYTQMPVCLCKEALKAYQIVLSHVIPCFIVYAYLLITCIFSNDYGYFLVIFMYTVMTAPDMILAGYILHLKAKEKPDYISIENHVHGITLYTKYSYTNIRKKKKTIKPNSHYRRKII